MKRAKLSGLLVVLTAVAFSSVGCVTKEAYDKLNNECQNLRSECNSLSEQNNTYRRQLDDAVADKNTVDSDLKNANSALTAAKLEIERLRVGRPPGPTGEVIGYKKTVGTDVLFSPGQATLTAEGKRALDQIAAELKSSFSGTTIRVYGYTDSDPIVRSKKLWQDNLDLSANRAMAVTRYLWGKGISHSRIETVGMGEANPIADNKTKAGKGKNRRVEIVAVKQ